MSRYIETSRYWKLGLIHIHPSIQPAGKIHPAGKIIQMPTSQNCFSRQPTTCTGLLDNFAVSGTPKGYDGH